MKTVPLKLDSKQVRRLLQLAREEDLVLQTPDGEEFLLSTVDDFDREIARQRQNSELMTFLDARFRRARGENCISLDQARRKLKLPDRRASRKQRNK